MSVQPSALPTTDAEWHRRIWLLAGPIIISNISVPLVGLVDTAVMGHLPDPAYIGAVAIGAVLFSFVFWGFGFLRMGTTGLVAQAYGRADGTRIRTVIGQGAVLALICAGLVLLLQTPALQLGLWVMKGSEGLEGLAAEYFSVRIWATPTVLLNYLVLGVLIGLQDTRSALITQLVLNISNMLLDLLFVPYLGWGVEGVALASVIAEFLALVVGILCIRGRLRKMPGAWDGAQIRNRQSLLAMLHVNANIMVRTLLLLAVFAYFTALGTEMGEAVLAANAVLVQLLHVMAYALDGFAHSAEALAGGAFGARDRVAFHRAVRLSTLWAGVVALLITLIYAAAGNAVVAMITDLESVRETAAVYLPWLALGPIVSVWSYQLDGVFIGATRTVEMRNAMVVSVAFFVVASHLLMMAYGNHGLWASLLAFNLVRALSLWAMFGRLERAIA